MEGSTSQLMETQTPVNLGEMTVFKVSNAATSADHFAYPIQEPMDISTHVQSQADYVERRARNNLAVRKSRCKKKEKYEKVLKANNYIFNWHALCILSMCGESWN